MDVVEDPVRNFLWRCFSSNDPVENVEDRVPQIDKPNPKQDGNSIPKQDFAARQLLAFIDDQGVFIHDFLFKQLLVGPPVRAHPPRTLLFAEQHLRKCRNRRYQVDEPIKKRIPDHPKIIFPQAMIVMAV